MNCPASMNIEIAFFKHEIKAVAIGNERDICRMNVFVMNFLPPGPPH